MAWKLATIEDVADEWQTCYQVRALAYGERSVALTDLAEMKKSAREDYKKILKVIRLVAGQEQVINENHVKKCSRHDNVYEMRAHRGNGRMFFFYDRPRKLAILTHGYWKTSESRQEQDKEFDKARELEKMYRESLGGSRK